jgi:hypothetical protein
MPPEHEVAGSNPAGRTNHLTKSLLLDSPDMVGEVGLLVSALSRAGVRYLVVGGVAVVLHGYLRATADLDLIIDFDQKNVAIAMETLDGLGFRPRAPVPLRAFADPGQRDRWAAEKNMQVFSLWHPNIAGFEVDLFVESPIPFDDAFARAVLALIGDSIVPVASIDDLIAMKRAAGRPRDHEDIEALTQLKDAK